MDIQLLCLIDDACIDHGIRIAGPVNRGQPSHHTSCNSNVPNGFPHLSARNHGLLHPSNSVASERGGFLRECSICLAEAGNVGVDGLALIERTTGWAGLVSPHSQ